MKRYIYLILILLIAFLGCNKDDGNFTEFSKPELFTPALGTITEETINNPIPIAINDFSSIADVSRGVISRFWRIDTGMSFLSERFTPADSLNLNQFIIGEGGNSSNVFFLFKTAGLKAVNLRQVFDREVSFLGQTAIQEGSDWVLNTTFTYNVFDNLNPEAIIFNQDGTIELGRLNANQDPNQDNISSFETITIEAGSSLNFVDNTTTGNPDGRLWGFAEGSPSESTEESVNVSYNRLGEYLIDITSTRDSKGNTLNAASRTKTLPYIIKVVPSSQPFIATNATVIDDGGTLGEGSSVIELGVNGELEDFLGVESSFTVNAVNGGFNQNIPINSAVVSSTDATTIQLTLAEQVYNTDTITISYDGAIPITSVDTRTLNTFTSLTVNPAIINVLQPASNPSFEVGVSNDRLGNSQGYNLFVGGGGNNLDNAKNTDGSLQINRSTEQSSEGNASMKFDAEMPLTAGFLSYSNTIISNSDIPSGEFILAYDIYIEGGSTFNNIFNRIVGATPANQLMPLDSSITDEWFTVERQFILTNPLSGNIVFNFRNNDNTGITGRQTFYLDNIRILVVENRP
ncbi:hypothetical protein AWE51_14810 [Aquimarina aggregata]|uniref:PKD domain-containing protein n=1 Tax=Aquimarina aggregata TaxID=1642818 RepID=A0A162XZD3_9FLAO|nr:hypothetical protein [Aquimarina aggregata]KZS38849.1 hypothetical protein AWE51_14810 [Aquimarina aggregata]